MMMFSFSTDALLLGHFTKPRTKDIVLDLCSGNGVIPLLLFAKHPRHIEGVEIQKHLSIWRDAHFNSMMLMNI